MMNRFGGFLFLLALGCSTEVSDMGDEAPAHDTGAGAGAVANEAETVELAQSVVIAEVALSETHKVTFREFPELRLVGADEQFHADLDGFESSLSALGVTAETPVHEIYDLVAGPDADPAVSDYLRFVEARDPKSLAGSVRDVDREAVEPVLRTDLEGSAPGLERPSQAEVGTLTQAVCAEPAGFDWQADESWFKTNFCVPGTQYCDALEPSHSTSQRAKKSNTHYFNQSFCSAANYTLAYRYATACDIFGCIRRTYNLQLGSVPQRIVQSWFYSSGKGADDRYPEWKASVTSAQGNYTAHAHFTFTN